jgi:hypothetical protein
VGCLGEERADLGGVVLDAHAPERLTHGAHHELEVAVIALVVLVHGGSQPSMVLLVGRLERLAAAERGVVLGHRRPATEGEIELDRHRLLAPQRPVVVEDGDPVTARALDVGLDRLARRGVVPRREGGHGASIWRLRVNGHHPGWVNHLR